MVLVAAEDLCPYCKEIDFSLLTLPYVSEVERVSFDTVPTPSAFFREDKEQSETEWSLGTIGRVLENKERCELCTLFGDFFVNHLQPYDETLPTQKAELDSLECTAWFQVAFNVDDRGSKSEAYRSCLKVKYGTSDDYASVPECLQTEDFSISDDSGLMPMPDATAPIFFAGRKRPLRTDTELLRRWINICENEHRDACEQVTGRSNSSYDIRLIDVAQRCVAVFKDEPRPRYAALSYVWGGLEHKTCLLHDNLDMLSQQGALKQPALSTTIDDFLNLLSVIGIPYGWVDALCIMQDDPQDMSEQISQTSAIYQSAFLTVVNAGAENLESPLPGLQDNTRHQLQQSITINLKDIDVARTGIRNVTLLSCLQPKRSMLDSYLDYTTWQSRAWTYQERFLSGRVLIFTMEQVFWSCSKAGFREETCQEYPQERVHVYSPDPIIDSPISEIYHPRRTSGIEEDITDVDGDAMYVAISSHISNFSSRDLSYEGDVYSAFSGMMQAFSPETGFAFLWGMPTFQFHCAMTWENTAGHATKASDVYKVRRRHALTTNKLSPQSANTIVPSWSWMGWIGLVGLGEHITFVDLGRSRSVNRCVEYYVHRTVPELQIVPVRKATYVNLSEDFSVDENQVVTLSSILESCSSLTSEILETTIDQTLLFFWSEVASFRVSHSTLGRGSEDFFTILGPDDRKVGCICITTRDVPFVDGVSEFVMIARSQSWPYPVYDEDKNLPIVKVLQLTRGLERDDKASVENELYERQSIGFIDEEAWMASQRQRRLIALK